MWKKQRIWIMLLVFAQLACTSCGEKARQAPELLEPAKLMTACRPVERGNIGNVQFLVATVVPMEYCSYFDFPVTVEQVCVCVGDRVKKGDVLAKADTADAAKQLDGFKRQLRQEQAVHALNLKIAKLTEEDISNQIKKAQNAKPKDAEQETIETEEPEETEESEEPEETEQPEESEKALRILLAEQKENTSYDERLYQYRIGRLSASIRELEEIVKEGTLKAAHAGMVTYIKNLGISQSALAHECIVTYTSDKTTYLEVSDTTQKEYTFKDYQRKYILAGGKEYGVQELEYSADEMILAKVNGRYPGLRFLCPEDADLRKGDTYPIYFVKESAEDVLLAGNDSLHEDGSGTYVYVKDGDSKVRRQVTVGMSDPYYTEIKEGLSEGELVYYESSVALPGDYEPYTVSPGDYNSKNHAVSYQKSDLDIVPYRSEYDGEMKKIAVEADSQVKKGDLLYVISTGTGAAAIAEAKNAVEQENLSYTKMVKEFDLQEQELEPDSTEKKILSCRRQIARLQHENTVLTLQETYKKVSENNDGQGNMYVYAKEPGTVLEVLLKEEDKLIAGSKVLTLTTGQSDLLLLQLKTSRNEETPVNTNKIAEIGEEITFSKDGRKGTCVGYAVSGNNDGKTYLYSDANGVNLGFHVRQADTELASFYVRMEDKDFLKEMPQGGWFIFNEYSMHDVIVLPSDMVQTETDALNESRTWNYVWRVSDGEIIKQYVLVDDKFSGKKQTVILSGVKEGDILARE